MPENNTPQKPYRTRVKEFVAGHKTALTVTATAVVTTTLVAQLQRSALTEAYDFIEAAGLMDKFLDSVPYDQIHS